MVPCVFSFGYGGLVQPQVSSSVRPLGSECIGRTARETSGLPRRVQETSKRPKRVTKSISVDMVMDHNCIKRISRVHVLINLNKTKCNQSLA